MPIYEITEKGAEQKRLVKADSSAQAIRHCAHDRFTARTISRVEEAADLFNAGVRLETAGTETADAPSGEQESDQTVEQKETVAETPGKPPRGAAPKAD